MRIAWCTTLAIPILAVLAAAHAAAASLAAAQGRPAALVVPTAGGGYCLAGADDRLLPVAVYQPDDEYDERIPDLRYILDDYARRLARHESLTIDRPMTLKGIDATVRPQS